MKVFTKFYGRVLTLLLLAVSMTAQGQTTLISPTGDGGFENGSTFAANGWTVVNHATNTWQVGTASTAFAGTNAAYVSNNGGAAWAYTVSSSQTSHFYRDITVPAGETKLNLSFQWKGNGESSWDRMLIYTAPTSVTPVAGTPAANSTTLTGATLVYTQASNAQTSYTSGTVSLPGSLAGTTFRLIFTWQNDGSGGTSPGASVDNISLTSAVPITYSWAATTGSASWAAAASWSPARNTPDASDILLFNAGGSSTATNVPTQTVSRISVSNNTTINLQAASTATLTIASDGTVADELNIASGSTLMSNGTAAALTITYSGTGSTGTIAGTMEATSATGSTTANTFTFTGGTSSVTTVTGILAAGQSGGTGVPVITGSTTALVIASGGTYQHKFTTSNGTIPTATWNAASNCNITGYTAASMVPSGLAQTFGNFTWNCTGQGTNNYNLALSGTTAVAGTLTISSTGSTGSLRLTGTGGYTFNVNNFAQTGGIFDLQSGASGTPTFNVSGTFNQSGGTFLSSATSTGNPTVHFNGTTNQSVTFATQPTGPITYRVSNNAGITLTGPSANFTLGNGTLGGLRISTTSTTPITFGGSTTAFSYNAANSTLTYDAIGSITARDIEFPSTNGPASLSVNIGSGNVLTVPFSRTVRTTLTMTTGDIDISTNTLELGTSATVTGSLSWGAGSVRMTSGSMRRWYGTTGLPTSAGTAIGYYPIAFGANNRNVSVYFSAANALSTGGSITVSHSNAGGLITVSPALTETQTIDRRTNASWTFAQSGLVASGTIAFRLTAGNLITSSTPANLRVILATPALAPGSNVTGTGTAPNLQVARSGLSVVNLANTFTIGAASADMTAIYNSIATGNWSDGTKWDVGAAPSSTDIVNITNGTNISLDGANTAGTLTVNAGGTLTAASNSLAVTNTLTNSGSVNVSGGAITVTGASTTGITNSAGATFTLSSGTVTLGPNGGSNRAFTNNGTLTVSGGTLNINGSFTHTASTGNIFTQSGGDINVDGNAAGVSANSVSGDIVNFSTGMTASTGIFSGGTFTIVDPHASSTSAYALSGGASTAINCSASHTFRFGNGTSTDPGTTSGFYVYLFPGSSYLVLGNVVANGGSGVNRFVSTTSNIGILGDLTINANSEYRASSTTYVAGNIVNNGLLTTSSTLNLASYSSATVAAATNAQSIGGSGVFRNAVSAATIASGGTGYVVGDIVTLSGGTSTTAAQFRVTTVSSGGITALQSINYPIYSVAPTYNANLTGGSGSGATVSAVTNILNTTAANMASLTVNNTHATGVTLNTPLSISGTFTLTAGLFNTSAANILQVGTATTGGSVSSSLSATTMVVGPMARTFAASRTTSGSSSIIFPIGKGGIPLGFRLDANTSASGSVIFTAEAFATNTGTGGGGVSNLSTKTWSASVTSGAANLTNVYVGVIDASVTATSKLLHSATINGTYNGTPGGSTSSGAGGTITTNVPIAAADYLGNFAYGDLTACTAPADAATDFTTTSLTTTTFNGRFSAAASNPTGYLVVRYPAGGAATTPVDGTLYPTGTGLGGTVVGTYYTAPFLISVTGLTANTGYDFYVYSFNNTGCAGPTYNTSALRSTITTCNATINAPTAPTTTTITSSSFVAQWTASTTAGSEYVLDVATNSTYTAFLPGYEARNIGTNTSETITGLNPTTTYYWRVRAINGGCYSSNATSQTVTTVAVPTITAISPNACNGPATLTITGTGLSGATSVTVGGVAVTAVLTNTATTITATVASGNTGVVSVTNPGGTVASVGTYSVGNLGNVSVTPSVASLCGTGGTSTLTASSSYGGYTYAWTSLTPSANLSAAAGTATIATLTETSDIQLTASDAGLGCAEIVVTSIGVYPFPSTTMSATPNDSICLGSAITLNSGLSAGNFAYSTITHATRTAPSNATVLATNGAAVVTLGTEGANTSSLDDGGWGGIPIGFTFNYFGTNYTSINVGTNGTLQFGAFNLNSGTTAPRGLKDYSFTTFPSTTEPFNVIAVCANDMDLSTSGGVNGTIRYWTTGYSPNRVFVVEYLNVRTFNATTNTSAQVHFFETTGTVEIHVTGSTSTNNKLVGLQNGDGTIGALALATTAAITTPVAYRFSPPSNYTTAWSSVSADNGLSGTLSGTNVFTAAATPTSVGTKTYAVTFTNPVTGCSNSTSPATINVTVLAPPTAATVSGATICSGNTVQLSNTATLTSLDTVKWYSVASAGTPLGTGNSFTTPTLSATTIYYAETNNVGCTNTGGRTAATVTVNGVPTTATAGTAQTNTTGTFTLAGNTPTVGTGAWSVVSGTANITDPTSATSTVTVTGTPSTSATLRWTISSGVCTPSTSDVTLNYLSEVGSGPATCTPTTTLNSTNSGQWLYAQHAGGIVVGLLDNQNLGTVTVEYKVDGSSTTRAASGTQYIDRDFSISSTNAPTGNVTLRLYFLNSELAEIGTALANAKVTRVPGISCSSTPNFTGAVLATVTGTGAHGATSSYIEISVPSFSAFYIQQDALTPLPIELKAFTAAAQGSANRLNWVTATEQNVSHFVVERSEDGRTNWTAIAQTKAVGNSQVEQKYQIFDSNPTNLAYYRLRSVDNNGKTQLSNVVSVLRQTNKLTLVTAAPMPFSDNLMVEFAANRNTNVTVTILDLMGRVVHTEQIDALEGMNRNYLNLSKLANGAYILNINDGEFKDNRRIIKQ